MRYYINMSLKLFIYFYALRIYGSGRDGKCDGGVCSSCACVRVESGVGRIKLKTFFPKNKHHLEQKFRCLYLPSMLYVKS